MTIREVLEEKNKDNLAYSYVSANYSDAFHDCEILLWEAVGDYQGDYYALVKAPDGRYGFTVIAYGSCSGCDRLEACDGMDEIVELLEGVRSGAHWEDSAAAMHKYLSDECDREMKATYISDEDQKREMWPKMLALLKDSAKPKRSK